LLYFSIGEHPLVKVENGCALGTGST